MEKMGMNKFADTYIWQDGKYLWATRNLATGIGATGQDRAEAEKTFKLNWGDRGDVNWINSPPLAPKRDYERAPIEAALSRRSISAAATRSTSGCCTNFTAISTPERCTAPMK